MHAAHTYFGIILICKQANWDRSGVDYVTFKTDRETVREQKREEKREAKNKKDRAAQNRIPFEYEKKDNNCNARMMKFMFALNFFLVLIFEYTIFICCTAEILCGSFSK